MKVSQRLGSFRDEDGVVHEMRVWSRYETIHWTLCGWPTAEERPFIELNKKLYGRYVEEKVSCICCLAAEPPALFPWDGSLPAIP